MNLVAETRDRTGLVGLLTLLVAVGIPVAAILTAEARAVEIAPGLIDWIFVAGVATCTVITFGALTLWLQRNPRARTGRVGLGFGVVAFLATPVTFWTMVPVIFGTAGAWLGYRDISRHRADGRSKAAIAAIVLGAVSVLASVAAYAATS
jgi:hypothetical protein